MIRRYSEEKHQSLWGAVCRYMEQAGCPINEREAVPEFVDETAIIHHTIQCSNKVRYCFAAQESGNGFVLIKWVRVDMEEEIDGREAATRAVDDPARAAHGHARGVPDAAGAAFFFPEVN